MSEEEVIVREAGVADYNGILAIGENIHRGLDYLPAMLKLYLHTKSYIVLVAETTGRIVSILQIYIYIYTCIYRIDV